jgi:uncharacterized membrane protein
MPRQRPARTKPSQAQSKASKASDRYHAARSIDELLRTNVETIRRLDVKALKPQTLTDRLASRVEDFAGSQTFIWLHVVWFAAWIVSNTLSPTHHFDPFPFTFLTLVVSLEAIFLSAFILMSQNVGAALSERRNQLDLQINLLTEQENTKMLKMLVSISKHLGVPDCEDPDVRLLEEATRPEQLARQIDRAGKRSSR